MGKHQKVKACNLPSGPEKRRSNEKKKTNSKPTDLDRQEIPFKLREIMRSRMEMKNPKKKRKRKPEKQGPQNAELQTDIPVPKFKKHKRESVGAYLSRMNQETQHVMFLSKNQPDREPEMELDIAKDGSLQKETSTKPIQKEESQKRKSFEGRRLDKKLKKKEEKQETHLENEFFKDQVQFGEVAMEPPTFMAKPRKSTVKAKPGEKQLLLKKLFDKEGTSVKPPGMLLARQRMMQEERERVVQAYRELKKRELMKREQEQNAKSKPPRKLDG